MCLIYICRISKSITNNCLFGVFYIQPRIKNTISNRKTTHMIISNCRDASNSSICRDSFKDFVSSSIFKGFKFQVSNNYQITNFGHDLVVFRSKSSGRVKIKHKIINKVQKNTSYNSSIVLILGFLCTT